MRDRIENVYLRVLADLEKAPERETRSGVARSYFSFQMAVQLAAEFPLLTTKRVHFWSIIIELLWFLKGDTNIKFLKDNKVRIWNEWADENGELGPVYGAQWRNFGGVDQIKQLIKGLKENPNDRGHIVSAWNASELDQMALRPCHAFFQCYVSNGGRLALQFYQRSADWFLGVPFNIASYALLTHILAHICDLEPGYTSGIFGDIHLYKNHEAAAAKQLERWENLRDAPQLDVSALPKTLDGILEDPVKSAKIINAGLKGYRPYGPIKAKVNV